ncbi:hypothetical protein NEMIN01_1650 [Nematocida minor]|uniref:uncharacterized protein n=1 Tax=Nematocida minor TaxID=1912983 RepID=UPI002221053C|nr:uncharacterized protein NEMIN01_1650 [Nematocida minor]KAI5191759.1 hypothetical protein NEMIN01_1650 [Nematocida minor]
MNEDAPEDLLKIYDACVNTSFTAWARVQGGREYTTEGIAHITYFKLQEECRHFGAENQPIKPLICTRIIGPFAQTEKEKSLKNLRESLPEIESIHEHRHLCRSYLVVRSRPWIASIIDALPLNLLPLRSSSIYSMQLDSIPVHFPSEVFISKHPTATICMLNVNEPEEEIFQFFSDFRVQKVESLEGRVYIRLASKEEAVALYQKVAGRLINERAVFVLYYPECLSDINLFL